MVRKDKVVTPSVTQRLQELGYNVSDWDDSQTETKLTSEIIEILSHSSKEMNGKSGYPDRIYCNREKRLLILVEEKPTIQEHEIDNIKKGCIAGIKWYLSKFAVKEFSAWKIVGIAVSGDISDEYKHKFSCYYIDAKQNLKYIDKVSNFLTETEFLALFNNLDEEKAIEDITRVSKKVNNLLRSIDSQKRPTLLAVLMICLYNKSENFYNNFPDLYPSYSPNQILDNLYPTAKEILEKEGIPENKLKALEGELGSIKTDVNLQNTSILKQILDELNQNVIPLFNNHFSTNSNYDIMGKFYEEFLKFAGVSNVKKGIVLTPRHITGLFTKLVPLKANDVILDLCCGTGAFLIAGMNKLLSIKGADEKNIKENQLLGFEINSTMYICAISNMLFRGDGKSRIYNLDSINDKEVDKILEKVKPTVGFINPPYSGKENKDDPTPKEITFLKKLLDNCSRYGIIIAPLSMYFKDKTIRNKILSKHTLKYVINMPKDLFQPNASTSTAIAIFETHIPHDYNNDVVFYDLKNDGFILSKNKGRTDIYDHWNNIEEKLLDELLHGSTSDGYNIIRTKIKKGDEWTIYAHSRTNYDDISDNDFVKTISDYLLYCSKKELSLLEETELSEFQEINILSNYVSEKLNNSTDIFTAPDKKINDISWDYFGINKVFETIEGTKGATTFDLIQGMDIPYIAAKKKDNGFDRYVSKEGNEEYISTGNGIVFVNLGDGSGGYSTYQPEPFIGMNGKTSVGYSEYLNKYTAMFLITILDKERYKYSFGRSWSGERFKNTELYLPKNSLGEIDWYYMEEYIKSLPYANLI